MKTINKFILLLHIVFSISNVYAQNETEPNETTSSANPMASQIFGAITSSGDQDVFSFQVNKPGVLSMGVTQVPSNLKLTIHMLDPSLRQWITSSSTVGGGSLGFNWLACEPGKYYIRIFEPFGNSSISQYRVYAGLDLSDIYECNNNFDSAKSIAVNQQVSAYINSDADRDYFKVIIPDTGQLNLSIPTLPSNMRMVLYVYDSTQTLVKKTPVPTFSGTPVSLSSAVTKGKHYIVVEDDNYNSSTSNYILNTSFSFLTSVSNPFVSVVDLKTFPNPTKGDFWIDARSLPSLQLKEITILNTTGQLVLSLPAQITGLIHITQQLRPGTYWIRIKTKQHSIMQKLFVLE